jgi:5-methylcytosine-specific restriction endonuclease McrA
MGAVVNELELAKQLSNDALISKLSRCVREDRELSARLLAHLGEVDSRGLYRDQGFSSMFDYCVRSLHMSESEADLRIKAARVGRQFPDALEMLSRGELHMTAMRLLAPVLTASNVHLLKEACFKSKPEMKELIAKHFPSPDVAESVRRLPRPRSMSIEQQPELAALSQLSPVKPQHPAAELASLQQHHHSSETSGTPLIAGSTQHDALQTSGTLLPASVRFPFAKRRPTAAVPLSEGRYKVVFTASQSLHDMLKEARDLCCGDVPSGEIAAIVEKALVLLIAHKKKQRFALTSRPRKEWLSHSDADSSSMKRDEDAAKRSAGETRHRPSEAERASAKRDESNPHSRHNLSEERAFAKRDNSKSHGRQVPSAERAFAKRDESKSHGRHVPSEERSLAKHDESDPCSRHISSEERSFEKRDESDPHSRYIPSALRREVYARDGGQCTFVSTTETRCCTRRTLEFDHIVPFAQGGTMTRDNLRLMCRSHNALLAERTYGRDYVKSRVARRQAQTSQRTSKPGRDRIQP